MNLRVDLGLFPYQKKLHDDMWSCLMAGGRPVGVLPTGGGKTHVIVQLTVTALLTKEYRKVGIGCYSTDILEEIGRFLNRVGIPYGWVWASRVANPFAPVQLVSSGTVSRRSTDPVVEMLQRPDALYLADEVDRTMSGQGGDPFCNDEAANGLAGLTATPWLGGGRSLSTTFTDCISGPTVMELQDIGRLARRRCVTDETVGSEGIQKRAGDFVGSSISRILRNTPGFHDDITRLVTERTKRAKAFYFVGDELQADAVVASLQKVGMEAYAVMGHSPDRAGKLARIKKLGARGIALVSRDVLNAGIDVPDLGAVVMLRHSMSPRIIYQQDGRGHRIVPGVKEVVDIFDVVGNYSRFDQPEMIKEYSFNPPRLKEPGEGAKKTCPECLAECGVLALRCPVCQFLFEDTCPQCSKELFFSTEVCRGCGYDRRTEEQVLRATAKASAVLARLEEFLVTKFDLKAGHLAHIVLQYSTRLLEQWSRWKSPWEATSPFWETFRTETHVSLFREMVGDAFSHWEEREIIDFARYLVRWKAPNGSALAASRARWLMEVNFGAEGLRLLERVKQ